jgi:hypothetical protein
MQETPKQIETQTMIQHYVDLKEEVESTHYNVITHIHAMVMNANQAYEQAEQRIFKKYDFDYARTCYDFVIKNGVMDKFDVEKVYRDHYTVSCMASFLDGEKARWTLEIPFNMNDLPRFVEAFEKEREKIAIQKMAKRLQRKHDVEKEEYERLKQQFEKD